MHRRRPIRLQHEYLGRRTYFVTTCMEGRRPIFNDPRRCQMAIDVLRSRSYELRFYVHAYCLMPDHVHLLVEGCEPSCNLLRFVTQSKQTTGYLFRNDLPPRFWQRRFYDYVVRRASECEGIAEYIWMNPVRKGLASTSEQYPFSGSFTVTWPRSAPRRSSVLWAPPWRSVAGSGVKPAPTSGSLLP
jgi:putative transposase